MEYIIAIIVVAILLGAKNYIIKFIKQKIVSAIPAQIDPAQTSASSSSQSQIGSEPGATITIFQNSKDIFIDAEKNIKISKTTAIERIKKQSTEAEVPDNFLGFINQQGETLQLLRRNENFWSLDSPVASGGSYSSSIQKDNLTTDQIIKITSVFFDGGNWQNAAH